MTATSLPPPARYVDPVGRLAIVLWVRIPRAVIRRLPGAWGIAGDGHSLVAVPPVAVLAPLFAVLGGLLVGTQQLGYEQIYTESLLLLVVAVALGTFSTQLGVLAVASFAAGELLAPGTHLLDAFGRFRPARPPEGVAETILAAWLPMVISYLILAVAVIVVPRTARALLLAVGRWRRIPAALAWPLASGLFVVIVWIGLRTWVAAAPTLIRPRFTWVGGQPTVEAIEALQDQGDEIIAAGVLAAIARQVLLGLSLWWAPVRDRVRVAEADRVVLRDRDGQDPADQAVSSPGPVRRTLGDVVAATFATLVLAGVLEAAWLWVTTFGVFIAVRLARSGVLAAEAMDRWKRLVARVPAVARIVALWLAARVVTDAMVKGFIDSYTGIALVVMVGAVAVFAVFPGTPREAGPGVDDTARPAAEQEGTT